MLSDVTPLILTFNEAPNIRRTLEKLAWAKQIVVVDSFSTDETLDMARSFSQVRIVQRKFDTFAGQCNFGLQRITTEWVLSLDADYVLSDELDCELSELKPDSAVAGYRAKFVYCIDGRPLRASLYPPRTVLYRRTRARYRDEGHGHRVQVDGNVAELRSPIFHDDRKPLDRWLHEQNRYAIREAEYLRAAKSESPGAGSKKPGLAETSTLNWRDRIRKTVVLAPILIFFYTLFGKGLILDGWPGLYYVFQRTLVEILLSLRLMESEAARGRESPSGNRN
jgi:glycosyltransferase involved in cell wall biosynthesis